MIEFLKYIDYIEKATINKKVRGFVYEMYSTSSFTLGQFVKFSYYNCNNSWKPWLVCSFYMVTLFSLHFARK